MLALNLLCTNYTVKHKYIYAASPISNTEITISSESDEDKRRVRPLVRDALPHFLQPSSIGESGQG